MFVNIYIFQKFSDLFVFFNKLVLLTITTYKLTNNLC